MAGSLKHRHQTALPNNSGPDVSANAWNDSLIAAGGSDGQVMTRDSGAGDGWSFQTPVAAVVPALSAISQAGYPATLNVSNVGVQDWLVTNQANTPRVQAFGTAAHAKAQGAGHLLRNFDWVGFASTGTPTLSTYSDGAMAITANAGDDVATNGLSANTTGADIIDTTAAALNYGYRFCYPATKVQRTLQIYGGVFSGTVTMTASLASGAVSPVTQTLAVGGGASNAQLWSMTFLGDQDWLIVTMLLTVNQGSSPNVSLRAILVF